MAPADVPDLAALDEVPRYARVMLRCAPGSVLADVVRYCLERRLVAVPVGPRTGDAELDRLARRVGASLVVDATAGRITITEAGGDPADRADPAGPVDPQADGLAFIVFTSGSTGEPKGVMLDRSSVFGNAAKVAELHGFTADRPHATCLPLYHVNALMMSLLGTWLTGAPLHICEPFRSAEYFAQIAAGGARTASIVPALLHRLLDDPPPWPDCLDYLITAAAPLSSELAARFYAAYGPRLRQGYGLSEAVNFSFVMPLLDAREFQEQYVTRWPPVGHPLPRTELRLAGPDGNEVWVRTPDVMRGYWSDPAATAEVLTEDGWLRTGDLGELRAGFLVLTGRATERINRGGTKYYPLDLERRWAAAGLTGTFAAVPVASAELGQDVGLVLDSGSLLPLRRLDIGGRPPIAARTGGLLVTATGKPRRVEMGRRFVTREDSQPHYERLLAYARRAAAAICASPHRPATALAAEMRARAMALLHGTPDDQSHAVAGTTGPSTIAYEALDALVDCYPRLADGSADGAELMRSHPGLWKRLMTEWPMGGYAELMSDVLRAGDLLDGRVLEVGCGVGNTTSLIADQVGGDFVWSDGNAELVRRGGWPGRGQVFDFDRQPPPGLTGFDTIFATNAIHCAADKPRTLGLLRDMLSDGGTLVLGEGANPTTPDGWPWALDFLFCAFSGWWDRSGFLTRWDWLSLLERAGFERIGFTGLRAGRHDLGGVIWGSRPEVGLEPQRQATARPAVRPHHPDFGECYGCAPEQPAGLRVRAVGAPSVDGDFTFAVERQHQGAPEIAHGGVLAAAMDEALGMAAWSLGGPFVTARLDTEYLIPVPVDTTLAIRTRRKERPGQSERTLYLVAEARLGAAEGPVAVRANAVFVRPRRDRERQTGPD